VKKKKTNNNQLEGAITNHFLDVLHTPRPLSLMIKKMTWYAMSFIVNHQCFLYKENEKRKGVKKKREQLSFIFQEHSAHIP